jgi:phosphoribosylaminoimidazolecarboxamide formyltransferase / IMP cyclohydrolase
VIERALLSVYDKTGLDTFARGLSELGVELVASGGTAGFLEEHELRVAFVEELTGVGELLGGRVKTLHPRIHAAILARPDRPDDAAALEELAVRPFQLVCVNLYPFGQMAWRRGVDENEAVEMIDIGGPAMLRAAAKNFAYVAPVSRPDQYDRVLDELRADSALSLETRRELAAEAFSMTAAYESAIARWFSERDSFPPNLTASFEKVLDLTYGENPHQRAAFYTEDGARRHVLSRVEQLQGKALSFNNLNDLSAARAITEEFAVPACVIVKHANPCGVALGSTIEDAFVRAHAADPVSAYGGIVVCNRPVTAALAERIAAQFVEVLFAPGYEEGALVAFAAKPGMRVLFDQERRRTSAGDRDYRRVLGGFLVQDRDADVDDREGMEVVCGSPTEDDWGDLLFAWRVCKHGLSNAIVVARQLQTTGIGTGQTSRVDAVRIAVARGLEAGHDLAGSALASDAFFPFADGPELALEAGVRSIIQPGGSKRDDEVITAVEKAGATMVFTHRRHFRH